MLSDPASTTLRAWLNWTRSPGFIALPVAAQRPGNFALNVLMLYGFDGKRFDNGEADELIETRSFRVVQRFPARARVKPLSGFHIVTFNNQKSFHFSFPLAG